MANENLKHALQQAGLTGEQFAAIIDVDPKTVQRWISGRTPYPRHRATIARALDHTEHELWPDTVPEPPDPAPQGGPAGADGRSQLGDVVGSWGQYGQPGAPNVVALIAAAARRIDIRHEGRLLRLSDSIIDAITDRARAGCEVRIISQWPTRELTAVIGIDHTELRISKAVSDTCLVRCDDEMLLLPLATTDQRMPAALHLRRHVDGGVFDRFIEHLDYEQASDRTTSPLTNAEQLDPYLRDNERHHDRDDADPLQRPGPSADTAASRTRALEQTDAAGGRDAPRRWPTRPG